MEGQCTYLAEKTFSYVSFPILSTVERNCFHFLCMFYMLNVSTTSCNVAGETILSTVYFPGVAKEENTPFEPVNRLLSLCC